MAKTVNFMVTRKRNEPFEAMLSRFTKGVMNTKVLKEYRNRCQFMTPNEKRRAKHELRDK